MNVTERYRAILESRAPTTAKLVLIAIADRMQPDRLFAFCGPDDIGKRASLCERQTRAMLADLLTSGLLYRHTAEGHKVWAIDWTRLAALEPAKTARGGKREPKAKTATIPANIAGESANIAGVEVQPDRQTLPDDRQSLPTEPANIAYQTGKDCTRSGSEAVGEAVSEADSAPASGAGTLTPQQQEHEPCPSPRTDAPDVTASAEPGGSLAPNASEARTSTTTTSSRPPSTTSGPTATLTPTAPPTPTERPKPTRSGTFGTHGSDEPPPPSDEDYYASEGLPQERTGDDALSPGASHYPDVVDVVQPRPPVNAPPAPQRRTAAVDAVGSEGARGVGQVVQSGDPRRGAGGHPQGRDGVDRASGANGVGGPERRPGSDGVGTLGADPGRPAPVGLFGALNGPSSASTGASHATAPAEGVAGKGGASGRGKRAPKAPAEPKAPNMKALIIEEWHQSHLARFGHKYRIEAVDAKRLHSLDHDRTPADLPELRAAFDTFFAKPFEAFPEGHTAMGFCGDPGRWIALSKRAAAGMVPVRNGRPVAPSYADTLRELEEMERAAATRNGAMDATYEVVQ